MIGHLSVFLFQSEYGLTEDQVAGELMIIDNSVDNSVR